MDLDLHNLMYTFYVFVNVLMNGFCQQSRKALERISVPKIYHPFIQGPYGERAAALSAETGARIHIPPASTQSDVIVIAGEKNGVLAAKAQIEAIFEEMVSIRLSTEHLYQTG